MAESIVARHGQITLSKELRGKLGIHEGDKVVINREGNHILVAKRNPDVWDSLGDFLPKRFEAVLHDIRRNSEKRFKSLGLMD